MKKNVLKTFLGGIFCRNSVFIKPISALILLLLCTITLLNAQTKKVTGTITDAQGNPLSGVIIQEKGVQNRSQSDINGKYSITTATVQSVLIFNYLGFTTLEEILGSRDVINVVLRESINDLDEVIVVGYGTQAKRDVTGAISSISAKAIEERQPISVFDAIQGAAPGVRVLSASGAPGEEGQITIRGISTLSDDGGVPLYIIDGVPMDNINGINPNDIQSIEILKDAASASIYGSRSANGVILITTKRGEEGKPRIQLNYLRSYNTLAHKIVQPNRLDRQGWERRLNLGLDPKTDDSTSFSRNADNDYQDLITQTGARDQVDFSMSGGVKKLGYYTSLQYLNEEGIVLSSYNKRFTMRTNVDYKPSDKVTLSTRLSIGYSDKNNIHEGNVLGAALARPANMALFFPDGSFIYNNGGRRNPIAEALLRENTTVGYKSVIYQSIDYKVFKGLTFHTDASADVELLRTKTFNSKLLDTGNPQASSGSDRTNLPIRLQGNAFFTYKNRFNKIHNFTALLGTNLEKNNGEEVNIAGRFYITEAVRTLNAIGQLTLNDVYSSGSANALLGFYTRIGYDYKGRYLINATIRRDGSSRFGEKNRWGNFPSLSAGWRFSDEAFMSWSKKILTDAKLRASWGITGNQRIGDFDALQQFVFGSYFYNGVSGVQSNPRLGNDLLKWEEQEQTDIGLDLNFFNGRLTFTGDVYLKNTKDLLYDAPIPLEIGYPNRVRTNLGAIQNKGIEIMVSGYPVRNKDFSWQTSVNWSVIRNRITDLPGGNYIASQGGANLWYVGEGQEAGNFYGYKYLGIYDYDQSNAYTADYRTRLIPQFNRDEYGNVIIGKDMQPVLLGYTYPDGSSYLGNVNQLTVNGTVARGGDVIWENVAEADGQLNGSIGNEDRQILGYGQPRWTAGWNNSITYKQISLSFSLYGSFGNSIYNENKRSQASLATSNATPDPYIIRNLWKYPGQGTDIYSANVSADNVRSNGSYYLEDGSFIRLQSVRLGYQLLPEKAKKLLMKGLNVYIYGNNLLTWTNYTGFDPEVNQRNVLTPGRDTGRFPRRREIGFGLNCSF